MGETGFNPAYVCKRPDIERLLGPNVKSVLDVGCSNGALGGDIKASTGARVVGIELSEEMAAEAKKCMDRVFVGDASEIVLQGQLDGCEFDTIIFADVLEHLVDPWAVLGAATKYLRPEGVVIASIPNVRHIDTIYQLLVKGYWPYRDRGIHDRTHLRFFTKRNIVEMFEGAGLTIDHFETKYRIREAPVRVNKYAKYFAWPVLKHFFAFQYLVRARGRVRSKP